jgi:hypothetical protein
MENRDKISTHFPQFFHKKHPKNTPQKRYFALFCTIFPYNYNQKSTQLHMKRCVRVEIKPRLILAASATAKGSQAIFSILGVIFAIFGVKTAIFGTFGAKFGVLEPGGSGYGGSAADVAVHGQIVNN